jgi:hypothetical protein
METHVDRIVFDRLNSDAFEDLVRALALEKFGSSGIVYPSGPDGGRDFTFDGAINGYEAESWNGYLVLQSKFKEMVSPTDASWLITQLQREKASYLDIRSGRIKPKYYILATNCRLSGADGYGGSGKKRVGGYSKVEAELQTWVRDLGISGFDIWPAEKIQLFLHTHAAIRDSFGAWVMPHDITASIAKSISARGADFASTIRRALIASLRRHQFAELKDAGNVADLSIRTSQVFIDVPVKRSLESRASVDSTAKVVAEIVNRSRSRLAPSDRSGSQQLNNRIVLLGGPGQGKSTVSGYIAQLFRSILLSSDPGSADEDLVDGLVPEVLARAEAQGIPIQAPRRYPVFVSLPRFADSLTDARKSSLRLPSLLAHICADISEDADADIVRDDLRLWLRHYPWIIILDGLDEVPPSGERKAVLDAIARLMTEVNQSGADALVIVTTRPQGYNDDLDPGRWEHWELSELPPKIALDYAQALGEARYPGDRRRRERNLASLTAASAEAATSRLMVSPLQVTILYLIVDTGGSVPAARWTLFSEYFEVLKKREKAKGGDLQKILERNAAHIGPIHQRAGLLLQSLSELEGGATSSLNRELFEDIVSAYLSGAGFSGDDLRSRAEELTEVALNRLVLLSAREEGQIRFDVRSLQEFMAAAALTAGEGKLVEARLLHIAGIAHWRHVFLIAGSRFFADDGFHHRRLPIIALARALDLEEAHALVRGGARLALEMFVDGIGLDFPIGRQLLAKHAIELIGLGAPAAELDLERLWEPTTADVVRAALAPHLKLPFSVRGQGAWAMLAKLAKDSFEMQELGARSWPEDANEGIAVGLAMDQLPNSEDLLVRLQHSFRTGNLADAIKCINIKGRGAIRTSEAWYRAIFPELVATEHRSEVGLLREDGFTVRYHPLRQERGRPSPNDTYSDVLGSVAAFMHDPHPGTLADALEGVVRQGDVDLGRRLSRLVAWPLALLLNWWCDGVSEPDLQRIRSGHLGGRADWLKAEGRWAKGPLTLNDIQAGTEHDPFTSEIGARGSPSLRMLSVESNEHSVTTARELLDQLESFSKFRKIEVAALLDFASVIASESRSLSGGMDRTRRYLRVVREFDKQPIYSTILSFIDGDFINDEACLEEISQLLQAEGIYRADEIPSSSPEDVARAFAAFPSARGLSVLFLLALHVQAKDVPPDLLDKCAFEPRDSDSIIVDVSLHILAAHAGLPWRIDPREFTRRLVTLLQGLNYHANDWLLIAATDSNFVGPRYAEDVLLEAARLTEEVGEDWSYLIRSRLKAHLDSRRSNLLDDEVWEGKLALPSDTLSIAQKCRNLS